MNVTFSHDPKMRDVKRNIEGQIKLQRKNTLDMIDHFSRNGEWIYHLRHRSQKISPQQGNSFTSSNSWKSRHAGNSYTSPENDIRYTVDGGDSYDHLKESSITSHFNPGKKSVAESHSLDRQQYSIGDVHSHKVVSGNLGYNIPYDAQHDDPGRNQHQDSYIDNDESKPRFKFLKRKEKYDPRKAIDEEKHKKELEKEKAEKAEKAKAEKKASRPVSQNQKRLSPATKDEEEERDESHEEHKAELAESFDQPDASKPKKQFLKRKTRPVTAQKVDWKKTNSRVECWNSNKRAAPAPSGPPQVQQGHGHGHGSHAQHSSIKGSPSKHMEAMISNNPHVESISIPKESIDLSRYANKGLPTQQQKKQRSIATSELEKAYSLNFYPKSIVVNTLFDYLSPNLTGRNKRTISLIPTIKPVSMFVRDGLNASFDEMFMHLEEHYRSLNDLN
eukprot:TRINITY_DN1772_c0_g2_i12.p1 TRINITY_DN1772_c0_g2~~TRINITY_DN1772_c0_g2_i12.p1  ORF type:complete len:446 (-),score=79.67 TRINITY_DN1772_c0_g2_i12:153-1490(-)